MMNLDDIDILELKDRYNFILPQYIELATKLVPLLNEFGKYKKELELLTIEFKKRGFVAENSEELEKMLYDALKKEDINGA